MELNYKEILLRNFLKDFTKSKPTESTKYNYYIRSGYFLYMAISMGRIDIVRIFISMYPRLIDKDYNNKYPLEVASEFGYVDIVDLLIKNNANPNLGNPLITAVNMENVDIIHKLCDAGANPNVIEYNDQDEDDILSPLISAIELDSIEIVNILYTYGLDIYNDNTLIWTCKYGTTNMLIYMLDVYRLPANNFNAMVKCLIHNNYDMLQILVNHGADINSTNEDSQTVAMVASYYTDLNFDDLENLGINIYTTDNNGKNLLDYIEEKYD